MIMKASINIISYRLWLSRVIHAQYLRLFRLQLLFSPQFLRKRVNWTRLNMHVLLRCHRRCMLILMAYAYGLISIKDNRWQEFINLLIVSRNVSLSLFDSLLYDIWLKRTQKEITSCFSAHINFNPHHGYWMCIASDGISGFKEVKFAYKSCIHIRNSLSCLTSFEKIKLADFFACLRRGDLHDQ